MFSTRRDVHPYRSGRNGRSLRLIALLGCGLWLCGVGGTGIYGQTDEADIRQRERDPKKPAPEQPAETRPRTEQPGAKFNDSDEDAIRKPNRSPGTERSRGDAPPAPESRSAPQQRLLPPGVPTPIPGPGPRRWRLGVNVRDTETGVQVMGVSRGSPAQRAGIEVGDVIVSVNGYQVGYVLGRHYDRGDEFQRRADANGHVLLLLWNHRLGDLENRQVRLDPVLEHGPPQAGVVRGLITFRERIALPPNAVVEVRIINGAIQELLAPPIAEIRINNPTQIPIRFEVPYDPEGINPRGLYLLQARILVGGRPRWMNMEVYPVITRGNPTDVDVLVEPVR